ncbi:hypothetical protein [Citrobacter cronae]|uniref:hypothetical protein n=1 Tax=Citrobacter cronae TaxID=1748967 RepID=UPI0021D0E8F6|nr:hypothetical protein [Citrobacter cronae]MCU6175830.1 hypothetical protein [Citrobacter cronae]
MNVISNLLFYSHLFSFLLLVCPWDIGFDAFLYRFLCPLGVIFSAKNEQWHSDFFAMGTTMGTKIADEPARLWTSMESKNPH